MKNQLEIYQVPKKHMLISFIFQLCVYIAWFFYIYGYLGHVCPVAFLGVWHASLLGCVAFTNRRPRFIGTFITLLLSAAAWALSFFYLHPNDGSGWEVEVLSRVITAGPFIVFFLLIPLVLLIQVAFTKTELIQGPEKASASWELSLERMVAAFSFLITVLLGLGYNLLPIARESLWNDNPTEWFDTVFQTGQVYYLFLFISVIALISAVFMGIAAYAKKQQKRSKEFTYHLLGYTFLGLLAIGTWGTFVYLGKPSEN